MQDSRHNNGYKNLDDAQADRETDDVRSGQHAGDSRDVDGWQKYRKWISKAPAPRGRRNGLDPSLYTWKGYRNWSEQIKRSWPES